MPPKEPDNPSKADVRDVVTPEVLDVPDVNNVGEGEIMEDDDIEEGEIVELDGGIEHNHFLPGAAHMLLQMNPPNPLNAIQINPLAAGGQGDHAPPPHPDAPLTNYELDYIFLSASGSETDSSNGVDNLSVTTEDEEEAAGADVAGQGPAAEEGDGDR